MMTKTRTRRAASSSSNSKRVVPGRPGAPGLLPPRGGSRLMWRVLLLLPGAAAAAAAGWALLAAAHRHARGGRSRKSPGDGTLAAAFAHRQRPGVEVFAVGLPPRASAAAAPRPAPIGLPLHAQLPEQLGVFLVDAAACGHIGLDDELLQLEDGGSGAGAGAAGDRSARVVVVGLDTEWRPETRGAAGRNR